MAKTREQLEREAKAAHDAGDYYTWGKLQGELDRLYMTGRAKPIAGCRCFSCRVLVERPKVGR